MIIYLYATDKEINMFINNSVKKLRISNAYSLRELSRLTGISAATISRIERGILQPTVPVAQKLSKAFGISTDDLFTDSQQAV